MKKDHTKAKILLALVMLILAFTPLHAQLGVGTATPDGSAQLDVVSTTRGALLPRMSSAQMQAISDPATGLLVYCIDCTPAGLYHNNGSGYVAITDLNYQNSNFSNGLILDNTTDQNVHGGNFNFSGNTTGKQNTAAGFYALNAITSGSNNVGVGRFSGRLITTGNQNTLIGAHAGHQIDSGTSNSGIGYASLNALTKGNGNTAVGPWTLSSITTQNGNTAIGASAGGLATGTTNVFIGYQAGMNATGNGLLYIENSDTNAPLIGGDFQNNRVGIDTAISRLSAAGAATLMVGGDLVLKEGVRVKEFSTDSLLSGNSREVVPTEQAVKMYVDSVSKPFSTRIDLAGANASDDSVATQKAVKAFVDNTVKPYSTRNDLAGANASDDSVATQKAVKEYVDGNKGLTATAIGTNNFHNGQDNMSVKLTANASNNLAIGDQALKNLKDGDQNIAIGKLALHLNEDGTQNFAFGPNALYSNKLGNGNFALGSDAGFSATGSGNVFIGNGAGFHETGDSTLYIDYSTSGSSTPLITGSFKKGANRRFGINRTQSDLNGRSELFQLGGEAYKTSGSGSWIISSDRRLKTNIRNLNSDEMLQKVLNMRGVTYEWNDTVTGADRPEGIQYGFIAQEIEEVWPTKINRDKQGYLATAYGEYDPVFVESIKALHNRIAELEKENGDLRKNVESIQSSQEDMHALKEQVNKLQEIISELAARDFYAEK